MAALAFRRALALNGRHCLPKLSQLSANARPLGLSLGMHPFSSTAGGKVAKVLGQEIQHEEEQYEQAKEIKKFLKDTPFKLEEGDGDVNMSLARELGGNTIRIEWQLSSPFDPNMEPEGEGQDMEPDSTDFSVTIEKTGGGPGMIFYCSTQAGEDHRFVIGNVQSFTSAEMKTSPSSYNGPDFEDLDDKLQESLDEYLAECGMNDDVCNFIDAMALDKEQREYTNWLKDVKKFLEG